MRFVDHDDHPLAGGVAFDQRVLQRADHRVGGLAVARDSTPARRVVMRGGESERFDDLRLGPQSQDPDLQCGDVLVRFGYAEDRHWYEDLPG